MQVQPTRSISSSSSTSNSISASASASLDPNQIRAMLREELGTALASALANKTTSQTVAATAPAIPKEQQQATLQSVTDIIGSGQWGESERASFHQKLAALDPDLREQAMQKLVQAIDSGLIKAANGGVPML